MENGESGYNPEKPLEEQLVSLEEYRQERQEQPEQLNLMEIKFQLEEDERFLEQWPQEKGLDSEEKKHRKKSYQDIKERINHLRKVVEKVRQNEQQTGKIQLADLPQDKRKKVQSALQNYLNSIKQHSLENYVSTQLRQYEQQIEQEVSLNYSDILPSENLNPGMYGAEQVKQSTVFTLSEMLQLLEGGTEEFDSKLNIESDYNTINLVFDRFVNPSQEQQQQLLEQVTQPQTNPQEAFTLEDLKQYLEEGQEGLWDRFTQALKNNPQLFHLLIGEPQTTPISEEIISPEQHPGQKQSHEQLQKEEVRLLRGNMFHIAFRNSVEFEQEEVLEEFCGISPEELEEHTETISISIDLEGIASGIDDEERRKKVEQAAENVEETIDEVTSNLLKNLFFSKGEIILEKDYKELADNLEIVFRYGQVGEDEGVTTKEKLKSFLDNIFTLLGEIFEQIELEQQRIKEINPEEVNFWEEFKNRLAPGEPMYDLGLKALSSDGEKKLKQEKKEKKDRHKEIQRELVRASYHILDALQKNREVISEKTGSKIKIENKLSSKSQTYLEHSFKLDNGAPEECKDHSQWYLQDIVIDWHSDQLIGRDFSEADLRNATFMGNSFEDVDFSGSDLRNANFEGNSFKDVDFEGIKYNFLDFSGSDLSGVKNIPKLLQESLREDYQVSYNKLQDYFENKTGLDISEIHNFHNGLARVRHGEKWFHINKQGEPISDQSYDVARSFSEGRAAVEQDG
ncbi:MAG: WG repeat-containing protein, partial [Candidatus Magasanikbacteria bacterium]